MNKSDFRSINNTVLLFMPLKANRLLLMVLFVCLMPLVSFGQSLQIFNASGSFTVPAGVTSISVQAWGAGGAGGGATGGSTKAGGGGGGGGYSTATITVTPGATINYIVGTGGIGDTNDGENGGGTSFSSVSANGGKGGKKGNTIGNGGAGGTGTSNNGQDGNIGTLPWWGALGGDGGSGGNGGNGGSGGTGYWLFGSFNNNGSNGQAPGGGGGGAGRYDSNVSGGDGADGRIIVSWTCPANAGTLSGNQYICTYNPNKTTTFSSTVSGGTWTSSNTGIATVNSSTGVVTAVTTGTATITYTVASSGCTTRTATRTVYVTNGPGAAPSGLSGSNSQCQNTTTTYTINPVAGSYAYTWTYSGSGATITPAIDGLSASVTFGATATSGNIQVTSTNACGTSGPSSLWITIAPSSKGGTIPTSASGCANTYITNLGLTGQTGNPIRWESSIDNFISAPTTIATTNNNINVTGLTQTTYYRAVVQNSPCTNIAYSNVCTVTITPAASIASVTGTSPLCIGGTATYSANTVVLGGGTGAWKSSNTAVATVNASGLVTGIAPGTADIVYTITGGCGGKKSAKKTVTINSNLTASVTIAASPSTSICYGTSVTFTATPTNGGTTPSYQWKLNGTNVGTNSPTYTNASLANGNAVTCVMTSNATPCLIGSPATSNTVTITVSNPTTPIVGAITQPDCVNGGSVILSGLPVSGTINQTGTVIASYPITGATMTISGLAPGTYNFTVTNSGCTSSPTGNIVIKAAETNTWTTSWSHGTPNNTQKLVFTGDYPPAVDPDVNITGCSCLITGGAAVVIKPGKTLTITNEVKVVGGGTLTFEDTASLVQINNAAINSGNIIYKRTTSSVLTSDYTYWSSPVVNQNLNISPSYGSGLFYSYNDFAIPEDWKKETTSTIMQTGKGYIIRGPHVSGPTPPPGLYNATFVGVPNNGVKTIDIGPTGTSNLIGNPYPSAIDADAFLVANSTIVEGTIYFWTHNTAIQLASNITNGTAGSGVFAYTSDDYASYNGTGGVATTGGITPTGKIAAGQAFFTTSKATGAKVTFSNTMRLVGTTLADKTGLNQQFFKTRNPKTNKTSEKNRIWLNMTNKQGAFKQTLVGYVTNATNGYDSGFDGESFDGNEFVDFYSINQDKNLVIQGRALPFDENDEVPLGYRTTIKGAFTIKIDQADGLLANQTVYLEDKLENTVVDLNAADYTFNTTAGTFNNRFVLKYSSKTLNIANFNSNENKLVVSNKEKQLKINSTVEKISAIAIYDLLGREIFKKGEVNSNELSINNLMVAHQTLIVKTTLQNGETLTNKVVY